jgi:hypothetical protein
MVFLIKNNKKSTIIRDIILCERVWIGIVEYYSD